MKSEIIRKPFETEELKVFVQKSNKNGMERNLTKTLGQVVTGLYVLLVMLTNLNIQLLCIDIV